MKTRTKSKRPANLQPHPHGAMFPPMTDPDYELLVTGMKTHGFDKKHPIILFEGKILDGNHRYTASKKAKVDAIFEEYKGDDPIGFVVQENLARRNLTPSQASMLAAELVEKMVAADKIEDAAAAAMSAKPKSKRVKGARVTKAAKALKVSPRSVAAARKLRKVDPQGAEDVKKGGKSLHAATKGADAKKSAEDAKTAEFEKATTRLDKICGVGFALKAAETLQSKHILEMAGLDIDELKRIKPFIEAGWTLKAALSYKSTNLTYAHNIRQLCDRAIAQGGKFMLMIDDWIVTAERKTAE